MLLDASRGWNNVTTSNGSKVEARHEAGGVAMDGKLYVLGGRGDRVVNVYDPQTRRWTSKSAAPLELNHFQPIAWGGKIWVVGAFTGGYPAETPVANVCSDTPATDQWRKESAIPSARCRGDAGAALHNGRIIIVGGNTRGHRDGAVAWVDSFDPATCKCQVLSDAPNARDHATVAIADSKLVAAGGRRSSYADTLGSLVTATDVLDLDTSKWSRGASIPTGRAGAMTVTVGREVVVIGGESLSIATAHRNVEAYDVATNQWRSLKPMITASTVVPQRCWETAFMWLVAVSAAVAGRKQPVTKPWISEASSDGSHRTAPAVEGCGPHDTACRTGNLPAVTGTVRHVML